LTQRFDLNVHCARQIEPVQMQANRNFRFEIRLGSKALASYLVVSTAYRSCGLFAGITFSAPSLFQISNLFNYSEARFP
jgi:hypothetical protein